MHLSYAYRHEAAVARLLLTVHGKTITPRGSHEVYCASIAQLKKKAEPEFRLFRAAIALAYWIRRVYLWTKVPT